jgi:hypothetical protein
MLESSPKFFQSLRPFGPATTQAERRAQFVQMASVMAGECFDRNGIWKLPALSPAPRGRIWLCFGLMLGSESDVELANAILGETRCGHNTDAPAAADFVHPFDIFVSNHCVQMLVLHAAKLRPSVLHKIEQWARVALSDYPGNRQADLQFHGYNDNMPAKAAMGMILGGEYFGDQAAVEHGLWSLRQLRDMLVRRGMVSEFNSPTYSPLTLGNLSEISRYARNEEARTLAGECAERVWADVLGHFHPTTGSNSGPFSRAYTPGSTGGLSNLNCMLWLTFGDMVHPHPPTELMADPPHLMIPAEGDVYFVLAQDCWMASFEWEPPAYLVDWMKSRTYPFTLVATAERAEGGDDTWHANEILATTYQQEDFALGTSQGDWVLHADELCLRYRRHAPVRAIDDVRTGYPRYLVNDELPGKIKPSSNGLFSGEEGYLNDSGRYQTVQHGPVAMVCVGPVLRLADKPISRMGFSLLLPEHLNTIESLEISDGHVWLQDGPFFMALRPLGATDWGRPSPVRIEKANNYRMIWLPNYEGPARAFSRKELACTVNGFIMVAGSTREDSFDEFRQRVIQGEVLDYFASVSRTVRYRLGNLNLGMNYGLYSSRTRYVSVNGKVPPKPIWQATGLPAERLPFLNQQPQPNSLEFPFHQLAVAATPNELWQIFSRGKNR